MRKLLIMLLALAMICSLIGIAACDDPTVCKHTYGDWTVTTAATCEVAGVETRVCSIDTAHTETRAIAALGHTYGDWTVTTAATCEVAGVETRVCSINAEHTETRAIAALGHNYGDWTVTTAATCEVAGVETRVCSINAEHTETRAIAALGHNYGDWTVTTAATCEVAGVETRVCSIDTAHTETRAIAALGHNYGDWTVTTAATCDVAGVETRVCSIDTAHAETRPIAALGHNYGDWALTQDPTLTEKGSATRICSLNAQHLDVVEVAILADTSVWTVTTVAPTYNATGTNSYTSVYGTIVLPIAKLVAPYDSKTYSAVAFDSSGNNSNKVVGATTSWNNQSIILDANGVGIGSGFPFRYKNVFEMIDATTGRIKISAYEAATETVVEKNPDYPYYSDDEFISVSKPVLDKDGNPVYNTDAATVREGYVDFATGLVVTAFNTSFDHVFLNSPFEIGMTGDVAKASAWNDGMAISYTYNDTTHNILISNDVVYFGVSFQDMAGNTLDATQCYNSPVLVVRDAQNKLVETFSYNGSTMVISDGYQGNYTATGSLDMYLNGAGKLTLDGISGTYTVAEDKDYQLEIYVGDSYYQATIIGNEVTLVKPMVTITFDAGEYATVTRQDYNINVAAKLPTPDNEQWTFKGWHTDSSLSSASLIVGDYTPTANITLYANWTAKVVINLVGVSQDGEDILYLGDGDIIGEYLPELGLDLVNRKKFDGWYLDAEYQSAFSLDSTVSAGDSGMSIYCKWIDLPEYYGTYNGAEIYGKNSGNSSKVTLTIDENGKMTGVKNGFVVSYDPTTQAVVWKAKLTDTATKTFYLDAVNGIIAGLYRDNDTDTDMYLMSSSLTTGQFAEKHYSVNSPKAPGTTSSGYYARFVRVATTQGVKTIMVWNNYIYNNITIATTFGTTLTLEGIAGATTLVVRDATTGELILGLACAASKTDFDGGGTSRILDEYFGNYTSGTETIALDGVGNITYGDKTGRYTKASSTADYGFDVYLESDTEYYRLTLGANNTFVIVKPMVTVTFDTGGHTPIAGMTVNANIVMTLPNAEDSGWVFNGFFFDSEFKSKVSDEFAPTSDITLYAKYSSPATLTIVYNDGATANKVTVYSVNDIATVDRPIYTKHAFVGWYTTDTFSEGTEWTSGLAITTDVTIYAKWEDAPVYNNTYGSIGTNNDTKLTGTYASGDSRTSGYFEIDPYGLGQGYSYPHTGKLTVTSYDAETGAMLLSLEGNPSGIYRAFVDKATGIIVRSYTKVETTDIAGVWLGTPFTKEPTANSLINSYWNNGKSRAIQYIYEGTTYSIFIHNNAVYFGVSFLNGGDVAVPANECYNQNVLIVKSADGNVIAKFGHDGESLKLMDGTEGTYQGTQGALVLNGVQSATLGGVTGTYTRASEGATYGYDVYIDNVYYELIIDQQAKTYTMTKPMVTISFDCDSKDTVSAIVTNKNIAIVLTIPTNDVYVFRGWYTEQEHTNKIEGDYLPITNTTIYAKWDLKVTLTVVYNNGIAQSAITYGAGDTAAPVKPPYTNGQVFAGWYQDANLSVAYVEGVISANTTIYCKWVDAVPQYGSYLGFEVWGSTNDPATGSTTSVNKTAQVDAFGGVTGVKTGTIKDYDVTTGAFNLTMSNGTTKYLGYCDPTSGLLVYDYSAGKDKLSNDLYVFIRDASNLVADATLASRFNASLTKLNTISFTRGGENITTNILIHNNKAYIGVTLSGDVAVKDAWNAAEVTISDKDGNAIVTFVNGVESSSEVPPVVDVPADGQQRPSLYCRNRHPI